ncbi:MAG: tetratricopeptide repeat protein [Bryobacteraceae bacterium]
MLLSRCLLAARYCLAACLCAAMQAESYLVVPFVNRTGDSNLDWVGESLSESIRESLVESGATVTSREDREQAARKLSLKTSPHLTLASSTKLGEALGCDRIIYGQFELKPDPLQTNGQGRGMLSAVARVMDRKSVARIQELSIAGPLEQLGTTRVELGWSVLRWAQPGNGVSIDEFRKKNPPVRITALESYSRGLMATTPEQKHWFFAQAVRHEPGFEHPAYYLGRIQYEKENYREAAKWLRKVGPGHPSYLDASFLLGLSEYELSEFEAARESFERVARNAPSAEVWNNLGAALARLENPEAVATLEKALAGDPSDPDYHFNLGYLLWQRGHYEGCAERFRAVLDRSAGDEDATLLLGHCLQQTGPRAGDFRTADLERLKETFEKQPAR